MEEKNNIEKYGGIQLWDNQKEHYERIKATLMKWFCYLDTSNMGSGKTIIAMAVCREFDLKLLVIGPLTTLSMWRNEAKKYGVNLIDTISYQTLRGTVKTGCNHSYLQRMGDSFFPTPYFNEIVKSKVLLVFDEMHNVKNAGTAQLKASHTLVKEIVKMNCGSRIALLSATPCDKQIHAESLCKMLGIIQRDKLYEYDRKTKEYELTGMYDLFNHCKKTNEKTFNLIKGSTIVDRRTAHQLCFDLYLGILKNHLTSSMPSREIESEKDAMNGYYNMPKNDIEGIINGEKMLRGAVRYNDKTKTIDTKGKRNWGEITKALVMLEKAKLSTIVRLAKETLNEKSKSKIILYVWYIDSIHYLKDELSDYAPKIMYGNTKPIERDKIIEKFQEDSDELRVLISNTKVGGFGISLDDRSGNRPRYMFIIPTYNFIDLHQATGRIHRGTTKSAATIRFVYCKKVKEETSILNAIAKKTEVTKNMIYKENGIIFPGDYDSYIEGEGIVENKNKVKIYDLSNSSISSDLKIGGESKSLFNENIGDLLGDDLELDPQFQESLFDAVEKFKKFNRK